MLPLSKKNVIYASLIFPVCELDIGLRVAIYAAISYTIRGKLTEHVRIK